MPRERTAKKRFSSPAEALVAMRESAEVQIGELRTRIAALKERLELAENGQVPKDEWAENVRRWVTEQAKAFQDEARHKVSALRSSVWRAHEVRLGRAVVSGSHSHGVVAEADLSGLLCWLFGDLIEERLAAVIAATDYPQGPPSAERAALRGELQAELDELELAEEALIVAAENARLEIARREDARPEIILSLDLPAPEVSHAA